MYPGTFVWGGKTVNDGFSAFKAMAIGVAIIFAGTAIAPNVALAIVELRRKLSSATPSVADHPREVTLGMTPYLGRGGGGLALTGTF